jgi:ABC-type multidrug transport system ATPase subunit
MLEISMLKKLYNPVTGIHDITISIPKEHTVAFIGPNGSGKSTIFNILGRVLKADSGVCKLEGIDLKSISISEIGFLPENSYLLEELTPPQMLYFINTMKELGASSSDVNLLMNRFGIDTFKNKKIGKLSQGMRKRVAIACALLGTPKLLVLDEPLNSLDIDSVLALKDELIEHKKRGAIILLSSHILDFLDSNVEQVILLEQGRIIEVCENSNGVNRVEDLYRKRFKTKEF